MAFIEHLSEIVLDRPNVRVIVQNDLLIAPGHKLGHAVTEAQEKVHKLSTGYYVCTYLRSKRCEWPILIFAPDTYVQATQVAARAAMGRVKATRNFRECKDFCNMLPIDWA